MIVFDPIHKKKSASVLAAQRLGGGRFAKAAAKDFRPLQFAAQGWMKICGFRNAAVENYASLGALAYRQCFAAGKMSRTKTAQPLQFARESSNGCISTSDVFYRCRLIFAVRPDAVQAFIVPFMNYAQRALEISFARTTSALTRSQRPVYGDGEHGVTTRCPSRRAETCSAFCRRRGDGRQRHFAGTLLETA